MNKFEDMTQEEVERVVTQTYLQIVSRQSAISNVYKDLQPNVPEMLYAVSREWFKNLSAGHISPTTNELRDDIFICSKALNELHSTGVYYRI